MKMHGGRREFQCSRLSSRVALVNLHPGTHVPQQLRTPANSQTRTLANSLTNKPANSQTRTLANSLTNKPSNSLTRQLANSLTNNAAFTLIELLIVVVGIVTLMGIVFRLAGRGGDNKARAVTIRRIQSLENALSGYYAAFGSYPPVPLHGVRDIYRKTSDEGVQYDDDSEDETGTLNWDYVRAACRSQPVAVEFPFNAVTMEDYFKAVSESSSGKARDGLMDMGRFGGRDKSQSSWANIQVFKFGVLSFLLPRYAFMMEGPEEAYESKQWTANNRRGEFFDPKDGKPLFANADWIGNFQGEMGVGQIHWNKSPTSTAEYQNKILSQPSQAVCARWMPNFSKNLCCMEGTSFFGVDVCDGTRYYMSSRPDGDYSGYGGAVYRPNENAGNGGGEGQMYQLNVITMLDGWYNDLYYYSPPPYQSYRVWSAGANGKTFPPWIDMAKFRSDHSKDADTAAKWIEDDIVGMSN